MKPKIKKIRNSFKYAIEGIITSFQSEKNMKIHFFIMIMVILVGIFCHLTLFDWILCIFLFGVVISAELFNTAIETVVDIIMPQKNENAKKAKDIAAGAVLILVITSVIIGLFIFVPKIMNRFKS